MNRARVTRDRWLLESSWHALVVAMLVLVVPRLLSRDSLWALPDANAWIVIGLVAAYIATIGAAAWFGYNRKALVTAAVAAACLALIYLAVLLLSPSDYSRRVLLSATMLYIVGLAAPIVLPSRPRRLPLLTIGGGGLAVAGIGVFLWLRPTCEVDSQGPREMVAASQHTPGVAFTRNQDPTAWVGPASVIQDSSVQSRFPLTINATTRRLEDQFGNDFALKCDAGWQLATITDSQDVSDYFDRLQANGLNCTMVRMIDHGLPSCAPENKRRDNPWGATPAPFVSMSPGDSESAAYWAYVDAMVRDAKSRGIVVLGHFAYLGYGCSNDQGAAAEVDALSSTDATNYGTWIADRYDPDGLDDITGTTDDMGNVIFVWGGDVDPSATRSCSGFPNLETRHEEMYEAVRAEWSGSLHTAHSGRGKTASEGYTFIDNVTHGDIDNVYSEAINTRGAGTEFVTQADRLWNTSSLPFFLIEGYYDDRPSNDPTDAAHRWQVWAGLLSGGMGSVPGSEGLWCFDGVGSGNCRSFCDTCADWRTSFDDFYVPTSGVVDFTLIDDVFSDVDQTALVPDYTVNGGGLITRGQGAKPNTTWAWVARSEEAFVVYLGEDRDITLNLSLLGNSVNVTWIDAATGQKTSLGGLSGSQVLNPPGNGGDWILKGVTF